MALEPTHQTDHLYPPVRFTTDAPFSASHSVCSSACDCQRLGRIRLNRTRETMFGGCAKRDSDFVSFPSPEIDPLSRATPPDRAECAKRAIYWIG